MRLLSRRTLLKTVVGSVVVSPLIGASPSDLTALSAIQIADAIRRRKVSCVEVVDAHMRRISANNSKLNAIVQLNEEAARIAAVAADKTLSRGVRVGVLHGLPVTVKDSFDVAGVISTGGTTGRRSFRPTRDATVVERLRAAGAIILGKTNTAELTLAYETDNLVYGRTNNPYDVSRTPGGSSGGAAAAIAAGFSALDICSDTGGSIRVPSHFCGIAGLKPTSGRVPRTGHIISWDGVFQSFTQPGPMARTVEDLALLLQIIAGPDGKDPWIVPEPSRDPHGVSLNGLRLAFHVDNGIRKADAACGDAVRKAVNALAAAGCRVEEFVPADLPATYALGNRLWRAAGSATVKRLLASNSTTDVSPPLRPWLASTPPPDRDWTELLEQLDRARSRMLAVFDRCDVLLCPPCAYLPLEHGATQRDDLDSGFSYSEVFNYLGWPAAVVRCGTVGRHLPVGVQIVASPWREDRVLRVALALQTAFGGWRAPVL